jgi:DNA polymerase I-like protein with 3'-5' exonuclease and polymerase domains
LTSSTSTRSKAKLADAMALVEASEIVGLDIETTGLNPRRDRIRLVQVSDGKKTYVVDAFKTNVRPLAETLTAAPIVVAHGAKFEWGFVYHQHGIALDNLVDTYLMARIAACGELSVPGGLGDVARDVLELELDKDMQHANWAVETLSRRQLLYAATDAAILPRLYQKLAKEVAETGQELVAELENEAVPAFALMGLAGLPVDKDAWDAQAEAKEAELKALEREMLEAPWMPEREPVPQAWALQGADCLAMLRAAGFTDLVGTTAKDLKDHEDHELVKRLLAYRKARGEERENAKAAVLQFAPEKPPAPPPPWNFGSPQQVTEIAYEILGFELDSTDEGTLLRYKVYHPFFGYMLKHRKLAKLVKTYGKTWFKEVYAGSAREPSEGLPTGRVYPGYRQIGTSTGRVSSGEKHVSPNAQNIPGDYRRFFGAPPGRIFVDADYSQIEVRILAKLLGEEVLLEMFNDDSQDVYRATAAHMLGVAEGAVTKKQRDLAKAVVLGMNYGLSARGLPFYAFTKLGITDMSINDAEAYVRAFYDLYPKIEEYHEDTLRELSETGSVDRRTLTGRLRANITNRNEAINAPVQGTAADGLKMAMALVYERLKKFVNNEGRFTAYIVNTLHDELLVECDEGDAKEVETVVVDAMLEAMDDLLNADEPRVKLRVDSMISTVWAKG